MCLQLPASGHARYVATSFCCVVLCVFPMCCGEDFVLRSRKYTAGRGIEGENDISRDRLCFEIGPGQAPPPAFCRIHY